MFIADKPDVVWNSYLDDEWIGSPGIGIRKTADDRAPIPRLRPDKSEAHPLPSKAPQADARSGGRSTSH